MGNYSTNPFLKIVKTVKFLCLQFDNSTFVTKYDETKYQSFSIGIFSNKSLIISHSFLRFKESKKNKEQLEFFCYHLQLN